MFVETMSSIDLLKEYNSDLQELQLKTLRYDQSSVVNKYLKKRNKEKIVVIDKLFKTQRNNSYLGLLVYDRTGQNKRQDWRLTSFHLGLMTSRKGLCAIAFYQDYNQSLILTPHFFRRYKERFGDLADWQIRTKLSRSKSLIDIIAIYFKRNLSISWIETDSVFRDTTHIFAPVNDGVALLQYDNGRKQLRANTFVTENMLNEKQSRMVDYAKIYLSLTPEERTKFEWPEFVYN